ncbi:iron ABC transporter permease [Corynebacterium sp. P7003]|uniref:Iron ABC transporter permease n=2 Tax=Corynebacterium pygosceleis TaxID=2800406 RepID=A0ABT3WVT0_9CORY|nr:iron ABC transporter permease [Corynebacterium pygosceleis]MCX7445084.1 iron ABC transporter permease [Corynebacterium pygosceleis]
MYRTRRRTGFITAMILLVLLSTASLLIGSNPIPTGDVLQLLIHPDASFESTVIHAQRVPRTLLVIVVATALGTAGALMQSLTRNPLADPGILGVNAGASLAVVLAVAVAGITSIWFYLWFAFIGAALAAVVVYILGGVGRTGPTPVRLALAGVAVTMAVSSIVQVVILSDRNAFNEFRFWATGSVEGRGWPVLMCVAGFIALGTVLAFVSAPALNALALGDEQGRSLGVRVARLRTTVMIAVTLLAGAATAAVGPIMFIGLGVPYIGRYICGPDQRWALPFSALAAPVVLLTADILARVVIAPQEIQTGIVTTIIGGPFFIAIVRRRRIEAL